MNLKDIIDKMILGKYPLIHIPAVWLDESSIGNIKIDAGEFLLKSINWIIRESKNNNSRNISINNNLNDDDRIIYNVYTRYTTSFDHNDNGRIDLETNNLRETGTFIKTIGILPYIKKMGFNTIYLLPITKIGKYGKKGNFGSPYAIADHYAIDDMLSEPNLGLSVDDQFRIFVEAAHLIGIKVILEFVFRTSSIDSDLAISHPEWFYWIKTNNIDDTSDNLNNIEDFSPPYFDYDTLNNIRHAIHNDNYDNLPTPNEDYIDKFTETPVSIENINGRIVGKLANNDYATIPPAFADWPPDDNQPLWSDVTYLKLYNHTEFNYIAYNTIRMYDSHLSNPKNINESLWNYIEGIVPNYIEKYNIDGIMIDMGHALPEELLKRIINRILAIKPDFIFWEENFIMQEKSKNLGYSAVVGYMPFDACVPEKMKLLTNHIIFDNIPVKFFATGENHNTPRVAEIMNGTEYSKFIFKYSCLIPTYPFCLTGFELGEVIPINTGLGFSNEDIERYPTDILPLFSSAFINWNNTERIVTDVREAIELRRRIIGNNSNNCKYRIINNTSISVASFIVENTNNEIYAVFANFSSQRSIWIGYKMPIPVKSMIDIDCNNAINVINNSGILEMHPMKILIARVI